MFFKNQAQKIVSISEQPAGMQPNQHVIARIAQGNLKARVFKSRALSGRRATIIEISRYLHAFHAQNKTLFKRFLLFSFIAHLVIAMILGSLGPSIWGKTELPTPTHVDEKRVSDVLEKMKEFNNIKPTPKPQPKRTPAPKVRSTPAPQKEIPKVQTKKMAPNKIIKRKIVKNARAVVSNQPPKVKAPASDSSMKNLATKFKSKVPGGEAKSGLQKKQLTQSLGFLKTTTSGGGFKAVKGGTALNSAGRAYDSTIRGAATAGEPGTNNALREIASGPGAGGPIVTKGASRMGGSVGVGGTGTGVQGSVSGSAVRGGGGFASMGSGGLSTQGKGSLSQSEILKTLQKYMDQFRYCYEKSLLYDSTLSGNVQIGWTIKPGGGVSNPQVVSSQLNDSKLHNCLFDVLQKIRFPSPKGGTVDVKYPFVFSSSQL